jgi:tRNA 2-thiouridine synthesizing protein E
MSNNIIYQDTVIERNAEGYLADYRQWNEAIAEIIAGEENLPLTKAHWEIIHYLRNFYQRFDLIPPMRVLIKSIGQEFGKEKCSSIYFYRLFPERPMGRACKIAGLPKPRHCL